MAATAANGPAVEEGRQLCLDISLESRRVQCLSQLDKATYLDRGAVQSCRSLAFSEKMLQCMELISDKQFEKAALSRCAAIQFSAQKLECLGKAGTPAKEIAQSSEKKSTRTKKGRVRAHLKRAIQDIDKGNPEQAKAVLKKLLKAL